MKKIKAGDMLAFDILYKKYSPKIYKFAYSLIKNHEETENIIQEVFLNFWTNRSKIKKNSSVKNYIFTITHNST
ncbi:MAG: RNA polymerase sigma-70 factor, partial [Enterococcus sp.]|nr:RNA polymerase sigma-70 factor [Enterococcus sp.]